MHWVGAADTVHEILPFSIPDRISLITSQSMFFPFAVLRD